MVHFDLTKTSRHVSFPALPSTLAPWSTLVGSLELRRAVTSQTIGSLLAASKRNPSRGRGDTARRPFEEILRSFRYLPS